MVLLLFIFRPQSETTPFANQFPGRKQITEKYKEIDIEPSDQLGNIPDNIVCFFEYCYAILYFSMVF